jgi:hypothetical protein
MRQHGALQALVTCMVTLDHLMATASASATHVSLPPPASPTTDSVTTSLQTRCIAVSGMNICSDLLSRMRHHVCSLACVSEEDEERGRGASAGSRVSGLQLMHTERCALAAAHTLICKETHDIQVLNLSFV